MQRTLYEIRFWSRVDWGKVNAVSDCWLWTGGRSAGYGNFRAGKPTPAHRFAYETLMGPIPPGLHLDHLCRVKLCVNPGHLGPVTAEENARRVPPPERKTHCPNGHAYTPDNVKIRNGARCCRTCLRGTARRAARKRRAKEQNR